MPKNISVEIIVNMLCHYFLSTAGVIKYTLSEEVCLTWRFTVHFVQLTIA